MDSKVIALAAASFPATPSVTLGAVVHLDECHPQPLVSIPLSMVNRHGLIAGATGTGKTKTLQLIAEQLSNQGVPVFLADIKGDVSGIGAAGDASDRVNQRAKETGYAWRGAACPVEFLSLTGKKGAQLRATVSSFGPLLLAKVLGLNETQTSVLTLVFKYCDDKGLLLLDLPDLRTALQFLSENAEELRDYGGISKASVSVLLRKILELDVQGAGQFFGEPEFDLNDLLQIERDGRGLISVLALSDMQDKPALFSTFMMWMLATLYNHLPEVGDVDKPKLVFFFDEAHLIFKDASDALMDQIEKVIRLIRSKGVGVYFVTQSPKDVPATVLAQLGHRVQHALRAFTADDQKALSAAARTYPKTDFYDIEKTLTGMGIGEAFITVLTPKGVPTSPFHTRLVPPATRMGPLTDAEMAQRMMTPQVRKYATTIDRESAREILSGRAAAAPATPAASGDAAASAQAPRSPSLWDEMMGSKVAKQVGRQVTQQVTRQITTSIMRGVMGAILNKKR